MHLYLRRFFGVEGPRVEIACLKAPVADTLSSTNRVNQAIRKTDKGVLPSAFVALYS